MAQLSIRIDLGPQGRIGPGKIALLEAIQATGSIAAGGRRLGMSYRRAWNLVEAMNHLFRQPVVTTQTGGTKGGGASLTDFGTTLIEAYRGLEAEANRLAGDRLAPIEACIGGEPARG